MTEIPEATWANYASCLILAGDDTGGTHYTLCMVQGGAWITLREDGSAVNSGTSDDPMDAAETAIGTDGVWDVGTFVPH